MKINYLIFFSLILLLIYSCKHDDDIETGPGELNIRFTINDLSSNEIINRIPSKGTITITDMSGIEVISSKSFELTPDEDGYIVEPIVLEAGDYQITEFQIGNDNDQLLYLTPTSELAFGSSVSATLPLQISVLSEESTEFSLEVLEYEKVRIDQLEEGLIAKYSFTGNPNDLSGNGLDGVLGDGFGFAEPTLTEDRNGNQDMAYKFNGTSSYLDLSESPDFNLGVHDEFSISTWINPSDTTNGIIISKYISAENNRMWVLRIWEGNIRFMVFDGTIDSYDIIETPVQSGWQHITTVLEDDVYKIYVNGVETERILKTVTMLPDSPTAKTLLGVVHFSTKLFDRHYTGDIDEVRIYDRALSPLEIGILSDRVEIVK